LVFDSYYFSAQTRQVLLQNNIKACAAINGSKYQDVVKMVESRILQPGDISAVYNDPYKELVLGYYNPDPQVCVGRFFLKKKKILLTYIFFSCIV